MGPIEIGETKDEFKVNLMDELDDLFKIAIRHRPNDSSSNSPEWNLQRIVLQRVSKPTSIQTFNFSTSLKAREIYESSSDDLAALTYDVMIRASAKWPTRDNCFINLIGTKVRD